MENRELIDRLYHTQRLEMEEYAVLISDITGDDCEYLFLLARRQRERYYKNDVYLRGLIEFSSYCKNDCLYCGIRRSNGKAQRYRLSEDEILDCCREGYSLGFRTFVLQSGDDKFFDDEKICRIVRRIKTAFPDCAVTLSIGERSRESFKAYFEAGADRYLLRQETADSRHYALLHPKGLSLENRLRCLYDLKEIGYQVGAGFMVGSPFQTEKELACDMVFLQELKPHMVGIGPFIPHGQTPFKDMPQGSVRLTLIMLALVRLALPKALIPATTALGTVDPRGREKALLAGANVCMPNLSPIAVRKKYMLYDNKICTGEESAQCVACLTKRIESVGCRVAQCRGDAYGFNV